MAMPYERRQFYISGDEIRSVRNHWAYSLADFAQEFDVCSSTIVAWEQHGVTARNNRFDSALFSVLRTSRDTLTDNNNEKDLP